MVATTGTPASLQAYNTDALSSGNVLWICTTSGRCERSRDFSSRPAEPFHTTEAGSVAFLAAGQPSISSLCRSNRITSCPSAASAADSWSTTRFSPLGAAERYRLCTIAIFIPCPPLASCQASLRTRRLLREDRGHD